MLFNYFYFEIVEGVYGLWFLYDVEIFYSGSRKKLCYLLVLVNFSSVGREVNFFDIGSF